MWRLSEDRRGRILKYVQGVCSRTGAMEGTCLEYFLSTSSPPPPLPGEVFERVMGFAIWGSGPQAVLSQGWLRFVPLNERSVPQRTSVANGITTMRLHLSSANTRASAVWHNGDADNPISPHLLSTLPKLPNVNSMSAKCGAPHRNIKDASLDRHRAPTRPRGASQGVLQQHGQLRVLATTTRVIPNSSKRNL